MGKKKSFKYSVAILLVLVGSAFFILIFGNMANVSIDAAIKYETEMNETIIAYSALLSSAVLAMMFMLLIIFTKCSSPSKANDENLLLSLPIKKTTIIISRIFYNYVFDLGMVIITLLPSYVVYYFKVPNASIGIIFRGLLLVLLLPFAANAIATLLSLFIQKISAGYRISKIIQTIISILSISLFLIGYYGMLYLSETNTEAMMNFMTKLHIVKWMVSFALFDHNGLLSIIYIALICGIPFIISVFFQVRALGKENNNIKGTKTTLDFTPKPVYKALYEKEMNRYISTPIYVTNTIFGGLFAIIIAVVIAILGRGFITNLLSAAEITIPHFAELIDLLIIMLIVITASTICLTASSISLEGKNLWIIKAHPVKTMDVFTSKILVNIVVGIIPLGLAILLISMVIGLVYLPFLFVLVISLLMVISQVGLLTNLNYPRFDWDNEMVPVKQSISVIISLMINFFLAIIPFVLGIVMRINGLNLMIVIITITVIYMIINVILYKILKTKGVKLYQAL